MIEINKGVPMPAIAGGRKIYPFGAMEIGESFFVPGVKSKKVSAAAGAYQGRHGNLKKFSTRTVTENGVLGVRCWRVE